VRPWKYRSGVFNFPLTMPLFGTFSFFLSNYLLEQEAVVALKSQSAPIETLSACGARPAAHLWTICSADFLNMLPRLLFNYYCLAIAAARFDWPICYCAPLAPEPVYMPEASLVAFITAPFNGLVSFFPTIPWSAAAAPPGFCVPF